MTKTRTPEEQAEYLRQLHANNPHYQRTEYAPDRWKTGAVGEQAFADLFGLKVDVIEGARGDGGKDLKLRLVAPRGPRWYTVDVKTAQNPVALIVETDRDLRADIYALVHLDRESQIAHPIGWAWRKELARSRVMQFRKCVKPHYTIFQKRLRPLEMLLDRYIEGRGR